MRDLGLPQLPEELVAHVLRHVELQQRLGSCSLDCKAWRAAARAATSEVQLVLHGKAHRMGKLQSLGQWLSQHAAAVTQLEVDNADRAGNAILLEEDAWVKHHLQLPYAQLQRLQKLVVLQCTLTCQREGLQSSRSLQQPQQQQQQQQQQLLPVAQRTCARSSSATATSSSSGSGGSVHSMLYLTSLTSLQLNDVEVESAAGFGGLSALTGLQELLLEDLDIAARSVHDATATQEQLQAFKRVDQQQQQQMQQELMLGLSSLTRLTNLLLQGYRLLPHEVVAPFSCLQQLQELTLCGSHATTSTLLQLPQSLTKLPFVWAGEQVLSSSVCGDLAGLTQLQHLDVFADDNMEELDEPRMGGMLPDFCSSMQQLRVLKLHGRLPADTLPTLVRILPQLSRLESLLISNTNGKLASLPASGVAAYSALLPLSEHITHIELSWDHDSPFRYWNILQPGVGPHLFPARRVLPQLKQLVLGVPESVWEWDGVAGYNCCVSNVGSCFGDGDVARLVGCCPGLERLWIAGLVQRGLDMSPLLQLTALTDLCIGGEVVTEDVASSVLSQLTRLRCLSVYSAQGLTDSGLLALTGLTQLTQLVVAKRKGRGISDDVATVGDDDLGKWIELEQKVRFADQTSSRSMLCRTVVVCGPYSSLVACGLSRMQAYTLR
jgi:hypothetical protein